MLRVGVGVGGVGVDGGIGGVVVGGDNGCGDDADDDKLQQ